MPTPIDGYHYVWQRTRLCIPSGSSVTTKDWTYVCLTGEKGDDAVKYYLVTSVKSIAVNASGTALTPDTTFDVKVMRQTGSDAPVENYDCYYNAYFVKEGTETLDAKYTAAASFAYSKINGYEAIRFKLYTSSDVLIDTLDVSAQKQGVTGFPGCTIRVFKSFLTTDPLDSTGKTTMTYHNDSALESTGIRWIDFMLVVNASATSGFDAYMCKTTHTAAADWATDRDTPGNWGTVNANALSAFFINLVAANATIQMLSGSCFVIYNSDNTIPVVGMKNETDSSKPVIWAGAKTGDMTTSPFQVFIDGKVKMSSLEVDSQSADGTKKTTIKDGQLTTEGAELDKVTIGSESVNYGVNRQPFVIWDGQKFDTTNQDKLILPPIYQNIYTFPIPWDKTAIGRELLLVNYKCYYSGKDSWPYLYGAKINANTANGMYFYENGIRQDSITIGKEVVRMVGYGNDGQFYGWIVLDREPMGDALYKGEHQRVLFQGYYDGKKTIKYKSFNGNIKLSATKVADKTGQYKITFSTSFSSASDYEVILSGRYLDSTISDAKQVYACIVEKTKYYFTVQTADDSTANNGGFTFMVIPADDWLNITIGNGS